MGISDGIEWEMECEAAGRAEEVTGMVVERQSTECKWMLRILINAIYAKQKNNQLFDQLNIQKHKLLNQTLLIIP